ncbi:hypothetical protein ACH4OY_24280, partial [Micromonospora rubida]
MHLTHPTRWLNRLLVLVLAATVLAAPAGAAAPAQAGARQQPAPATDWTAVPGAAGARSGPASVVYGGELFLFVRAGNGTVRVNRFSL